MSKCSAIKASGERCKGIPIDSSGLCHAHHPNRAEARKNNGRKGARIGGRGRKGKSEIREIKEEIREIIAGVLEGDIERARGSIAFQGYNMLLKATEIERKIKETEELEQRVAELERNRNGRFGGGRWGS